MTAGASSSAAALAAELATDVVSASDWCKGIGLSIAASLIGGASKLAIRKSWILERGREGTAAVGDAPLLPCGGDSEGRARRGRHDREAPAPRAPSPSTTILPGEREEVRSYGSSEETNDDLGGAAASKCEWALPLRLAGMFGMSVLNPACCVLAMNYASPSILAPFSGLTLVWVLLGAHPALAEAPSGTQILAAALIILGEVVVAVFGDHTNEENVSVQQLIRSYRAPDFVAYMVGLTVYLSVLTYWIRSKDTSPILRRFAWGSCGGSITGLQNFLKDALVLVKVGDLAEHWPLLAVFAAGAAGSAFVGLLLLTACMKRYDATYSAAAFVGSFVVSASIMSAAHYHTFAALRTRLNVICYPLGLVVLLLGVGLLVRDSGMGNGAVNIVPDTDSDAENDDDDEGGQPRHRSDSDDSQPFRYQQVDDNNDANGAASII